MTTESKDATRESWWWEAEKNRSSRLNFLRDTMSSKKGIGGDYLEEIKLGLDKIYWWTKTFKETDGEPWVIRRARSLEALLENAPVFIKDQAQLAGHSSSRPDEIVLQCDTSYMNNWDAYYDKQGYINEKDKEWVADAINYWEPLCFQTQCEKIVTEQFQSDLMGTAAMMAHGMIDGTTSAMIQWDFVFEHGFEKIIEMIDKNIDDAFYQLYETPARPETVDLLPKIVQWRAMRTTAEANITWAKRHGRLAKILAENFETDPKRKAELLKMSEMLDKIPAKPPEHFHEAVQMVHVVGMPTKLIERNHTGYGFRPDQLWWATYKRDVIDEKTLTREEALDLIGEWQLVMHENTYWTMRAGREALAGGTIMVQALTLGGVKDDGSDACNDLTDLVMQAARMTRLAYPTYVFRFHPKARVQTLREVFETQKHGLGYPQMQNDTVHTHLLSAHFGVTLEEARSWANVVCLSPNITKGRGGQGVRYASHMPVAVKYFELTLHDGFDPVMGIQAGPKTGDASKFETWEEFYSAWKIQQDYVVQRCCTTRNAFRWVETQYMQQPLLSCCFERCVNSGIDVTDPRNGEPPNVWNTILIWAETGDCLYAVKKLVFDDKKYTMEQLIDAIKLDWEGHEDMRREFATCPKWGNDLDGVDEVNVMAVNELIAAHVKHHEWGGGHFLTLPQAVGGYAAMAPRVGALPNGRRQGDPLYDGGNSPGPGMDKKGPTAVLRSCSKLDYRNMKNNLLNQRLSATQMVGEKGFQLWLNYIKTWHDLGIPHVQLNVVDTETLRAAQIEPEKYSELIVRVAGYSAHFVDLTRLLQDSIIARSVQEI